MSTASSIYIRIVLCSDAVTNTQWFNSKIQFLVVHRSYDIYSRASSGTNSVAGESGKCSLLMCLRRKSNVCMTFFAMDFFFFKFPFKDDETEARDSLGHLTKVTELLNGIKRI